MVFGIRVCDDINESCGDGCSATESNTAQSEYQAEWRIEDEARAEEYDDTACEEENEAIYCKPVIFSGLLHDLASEQGSAD